MQNRDLKRVSRLTAILTLLETKKIVIAQDLADKFSVSKRTIYRDIEHWKSLEFPFLKKKVKGTH